MHGNIDGLDAVSGGISSGGHLAMLLGMRPHDSRYPAIPLPGAGSSVDSTVRGVIMRAPVIDPLGRYRYAKQLKESGNQCPEFVDLVLPLQDKYWKTEEAVELPICATAIQLICVINCAKGYNL